MPAAGVGALHCSVLWGAENPQRGKGAAVRDLPWCWTENPHSQIQQQWAIHCWERWQMQKIPGFIWWFVAFSHGVCIAGLCWRAQRTEQNLTHSNFYQLFWCKAVQAVPQVILIINKRGCLFCACWRTFLLVIYYEHLWERIIPLELLSPPSPHLAELRPEQQCLPGSARPLLFFRYLEEFQGEVWVSCHSVQHFCLQYWSL